MPGIAVRSLVKHYGTVEALRGADLTVDAGEIVVLLGRNGAGKTTLIRILATTILPDSGSASIAGFDVVEQASAARRATGLVLGDQRSFYWRLSGRANLEFFAALSGLARAVAQRTVAAVLHTVELSEVADRRYDRYSAGMRARLSLARALLLDPPVLLLDEPTQAMDPMVGAEMRQRVVELARNENRSVLWVTHDLHEAVLVGDRIRLADNGRVLQEDLRPKDAEELETLFLERVGGE